jgi:hypothetical protein
MNLFQIGLLFSLTVHTYLLTCETGYWSIFIYVYMTGCVKFHVYFSTFVFANESWFFLCRVLSFIFYWLRGLPARGRSVTFPVWRKRCISRTMMEWLTLKWSTTLLWLKPPLCMPTACHLSGMVKCSIYIYTVRQKLSTTDLFQ